MQMKYPSPKDAMMRPVRQRVAQEVSVDAPVGGWNTRDSIDSMPPTDAILLDNWFPDLGAVRVREGVTIHTDSDDIPLHTPGRVESLMVYEDGDTLHLLAADGGMIYNATTVDTPSSLKTGFSNNRWQWANFGGKLGLVNGEDAPQEYDGSTVSNMTISGPTVNNLIGINTFKNRSYFWEDDSQDFWYSALDTLGGTLTQFPLSRVGQFGGKLMMMETWTRDGGAGPDDYAVFIMSSGEAIVYQGSSPATGGDWSLVGVYRIGAPLSRRAAVKFGGDLYIITDLDYVNLSTALVGDEAFRQRTKVIGALRDALTTQKDNFGWEAIVYPVGKMLIFNIPGGSQGDLLEQHVMNTITGAWTRFKGMYAYTWAVFDGELYYGAFDGIVYKYGGVYTDEIQGGTTDAVESAMQPAWNPMATMARKSFKAHREFYRTKADVNISNRYAVDYDNFGAQQYPNAVPPVGTAWGSPWGSPWTSEERVFSRWQAVSGYGSVISFRKYLRTKQDMKYLGSTWLFEQGERL